MSLKILTIGLLIIASFFCLASNAQEQPKDSVLLDFHPYGSFRAHMAYYDDELELQENVSRIGFQIGVTNKKGLRFFVGAELAMNLFKGPVQFNTDGNTNSGFLAIQNSQNRQVFSTRLGYVGIDFKKYGTIQMGKQWSVYYDITQFTDKFNVFGGQGSATYVGNSDGGGSGTGRANQSVTYRLHWHNWFLGLQGQFDSTSNNYLVDGYGISLQYELLDGLKIGSAINKKHLSRSIRENTLGLDGNPLYWSLGASFENSHWDLGFVYAYQENGDYADTVIENELIIGIYDAIGLELFTKFKQPRYSLIAGFNTYQPKISNVKFQSDLKHNYIILGGEYKPFRFGFVYLEYRISNATDEFGVSDFNVLTAGLRLDLETKGSKFLKFPKLSQEP